MNRKIAIFKAGVAYLLGATVCLAGTFSWTGAGSDDDWDTIPNWSGLGGSLGYPDDYADDAIIEGPGASPATTTVNLVDETIDDLTVTGRVSFEDPANADPQLHVDTFTITGPAYVTLEGDFDEGVMILFRN